MTRVSRHAFDRALEDLLFLTDPPTDVERLEFAARDTTLDTPYRAAEAAGAALAAGGQLAARIGQWRGSTAGDVKVDSRHAESSLVSFAHLRFTDPDLGLAPRIPGEARTAAAGFYRTADDRWIYLHSGFPHNTAGLLKLLNAPDDKAAVTRAVADWPAQALEDAIAAAGLCGAMVRNGAQWDEAPVGRALAARPVVEVIQIGDSPPEPFPADRGRPLQGLRVLDLTRILAGPTCARTLASYGAEVLRIGAEHLPSIPLFAVDTGFGKRACHLDLGSRTDAQRLNELLPRADVFSQGYRTGAMERLGFGVDAVTAGRLGIVYVSINCYGHEGAWRTRPGWEQLAQTVTGMAAAQGDHQGLDQPALLPAALWQLWSDGPPTAAAIGCECLWPVRRSGSDPSAPAARSVPGPCPRRSWRVPAAG